MPAIENAIETDSIILKDTTPSTDFTPGVEEVFSDGSTQSLEEVEQENQIHSLLLWNLLTQAIDFFWFQVRNIILSAKSTSASNILSIIAKQSEPVLLLIGSITVLIEGIIRGRNLYHAKEGERLIPGILMAVPLFKAAVLSLFDTNYYYEEINTADPKIANAAGLSFPALILFEMVVAAIMTGKLPTTNYLSITFFVDFFAKSVIFPGTILQYLSKPELELIGYCLAALGFSFVIGNVSTLIRHHNADLKDANLEAAALEFGRPDADEETPLRAPSQSSLNAESLRDVAAQTDEGETDGETFGLSTDSRPASSQLVPRTGSINDGGSTSTVEIFNAPPSVQSSSCWASLWAPVCDRMQRVIPYFNGDDVSKIPQLRK